MTTQNITHIIFDWGDTLMKDFPEKSGPMAYWDEVEVIDGVNTVLQQLSSGYILAVATNAGFSDTSLMKEALKRGKIDHYFSYFYSSKELGYSKPDIMFFMEICSKMGVLPHQCLFAGNDYRKDIEGAKKSGMTTILFDHFSENKEAPMADFIITHFSQLLTIPGL